MTKLPQTLIVTVDQEGTDDEFLNAVRDAKDAAEMGVKKRGGVYVLKELITIEGTATVSASK